MRTKAYVAAGVVVVGLLAFLWIQGVSDDDEAPIIVRGGSIEIETGDGEWKDGNDAWINQTTGKHNDKELWVKVTSSTATCRAFGQPVMVEYSQQNVRAVFTTGGNFFRHKTRVGPKAGVTYVDRNHLRAGTAGDGGRITEVRAQNLTCSIPAGSANVEISICSSSKTPACQ